MAIEFRVDGMDELVAKMRGMARGDLDKAVQDTVREWGTYAFNASQMACPVDTGILAESGEMYIENGGMSAVIKYKAPYAMAVEYGWRRDTPILPVNKKALSWEAGKKGRLLLQAKPNPDNRVTVSKVITPARFKGISFVRVPVKRALEYLGAFWGQSIDKLKRGDLG